MNIAFVGYDSEPLMGGVGTVTYTLVKSLYQFYGINSYLIYNQSTSVPATFFRDKFYYRRRKVLHSLIGFLKIHQIEFIIEQGNCLIDWHELRMAANECNCKIISVIHAKPDLIRVFPSYYSLSWEFRRITKFFSKAVILLKIVSFPLYKSVSNYRYIRWKRDIYNNADKVVVLSKYYIPNFINLLKIKNNNKVLSIPNPLRFDDHFKKEDLQNKKNEVLIVSRLCETEKFLSRIFHVWKLIESDYCLSDWKLVIVGDGQDLGNYVKISENFGLKNVHFEGVRDPLKYYSDAKIFLMSSMHEGFPMTILEALQMGIPVVAFDNFESLHELIIHNYNGYNIEKNDVNLFASRLAALMKDDEERIRLAENAIVHSHQFSAEKIAGKWLDLFKSFQ